MTTSMKQMSFRVAAFGLVSFILGIIAENIKKTVPVILAVPLFSFIYGSCALEIFGVFDAGCVEHHNVKQNLGNALPTIAPPSGTRVAAIGIVICTYPYDPSIIIGLVSVVSLTASAILGFYSIFYDYHGKSVPRYALFQSTLLVFFLQVALWVTVLAEGMLLGASITEYLHSIDNVHNDMDAECATAKTGLFGGGAFLALDAALLWLVCLMLASNARDDYFDEQEENCKGDYGTVFVTEYDANGQNKV